MAPERDPPPPPDFPTNSTELPRTLDLSKSGRSAVSPIGLVNDSLAADFPHLADSTHLANSSPQSGTSFHTTPPPSLGNNTSPPGNSPQPPYSPISTQTGSLPDISASITQPPFSPTLPASTSHTSLDQPITVNVEAWDPDGSDQLTGNLSRGRLSTGIIPGSTQAGPQPRQTPVLATEYSGSPVSREADGGHFDRPAPIGNHTPGILTSPVPVAGQGISWSHASGLWHADPVTLARPRESYTPAPAGIYTSAPRVPAHLTSNSHHISGRSSYRFRPYSIPTPVTGPPPSALFTPARPTSTGLIFRCNPLCMGNQIQYLIDLRHPLVPNLVRNL